MLNLQTQCSHCPNCSKANEPSASRYECKAPCCIISHFLKDYQLPAIRQDLQALFYGFMLSDEVKEMEGKERAGLFFHYMAVMELLSSMQEA